MERSNKIALERLQEPEIHNKNVMEFRRTQESYDSVFSGLVRPDKVLMVAIGLLMVIGLVMMTSASIPKAGAVNDGTGWIFNYGARQFVFMIVGLCAGVLAYCIPTAWWFKHSYRILLVGILLLVVVQIPGVSPTINGSNRWIPLGVANLQTSELTRICVIVYASAFLQRYQNQIHNSFSAMLRLMAVLSLVGLLLLMQPDFGSTVVIFAVVLGMMFLAGVCWIRFITSIGVVATLGLCILLLEPYRRARLFTYLTEDPLENMFTQGSFQLANSLIAIGRGQITGVGVGESMEKHAYLPEAHTDFILAILAEETGLIGVCFLMILFGIVVWRSFVIASNAEKVRLRFASCIAYGVGLWIGLQALINMGVACGLLPTKGLTLPLISYGGSSVLASLILLAMLLRIDSESRYLLENHAISARETIREI